MRTPSAILSSSRNLLAVTAGFFLVVGVCACRSGVNKNTNANDGGSKWATKDPEKARRQAQGLVDQGKELYKNDQDEQEAVVFNQAIDQEPGNPEGRLLL